MKTTKNIWNSFMDNWMRVPADKIETIRITMKATATKLSQIRASDINVHFGEG